jgi:hypothetical protein
VSFVVTDVDLCVQRRAQSKDRATGGFFEHQLNGYDIAAHCEG